MTDNGVGTNSGTLTSPTAGRRGDRLRQLNAGTLAATAVQRTSPGPPPRSSLTESGSTVAVTGHTLTATIADATATRSPPTLDRRRLRPAGRRRHRHRTGERNRVDGIATKTSPTGSPGQIDLDAQAAGLATGTASYTIATGPVSAAASDSTVVAAPSTVYANGSDAATITVTLRDAGGNAIPGKTVTLAQGSGGSSISGGGSTNAFGVVTFSATNTAVETVTYTATDTTDAITVTDDTTVDFIFADGTTPTNSITLGSATRAWLSGTTLYYNGAAGGSFTLSSAVADGGSGPAPRPRYPAVTQPGWTHGAETVSTPSGGPYVSSAFAFAAGSTLGTSPTTSPPAMPGRRRTAQ